ncbi:glyoxylate/hydroxypyruvate reductase A [Marinobacter nanhaiticus D15-8W]|uniref:Glyoxylate/hydroxypyruvate reductase A n=1 Tax=Marinobacter nanhaiticus D15-8W TaxID=626887 RepID=N6WWL4_9GAMM|nr:glyoxylate/hydroxypyruvate reductase A [Marinobacter nanhaiticus]ENO15996.1 glyoxylate/hydroxypyruvate reductase A [Marinobacter nanhaiticus D15-8W]BES73146.1 glyoxylate/hydroxypyruvate reductase A [Marinobacter nanhaiticus D15-8W]
MPSQTAAPNILIAAQGSEPRWRDALAERLPGATIVTADEDYAPETIDYALLWKQPEGLVETLPNLQAIFSLGAGVEHLLAARNLPDNVPIIRLEDAGMAEQMVQYHLYAALHFMRDFDIYSAQQARGEWAPHDVSRIAHCRVGVMGLGALGAAVASALADVGFDVSGWSRSSKSIDGVSTYAGHDTLEAFLGEVDILMCLLPNTAETTRMLDSATLSRLPEGAAIINAARGSIIDEADLLHALDTGHIRGAFLDVAATEPLPESHPFWRHPKVRLTPHIAAATRIDEAADQIAGNIRRIARGEGPRGLVDRHRGY